MFDQHALSPFECLFIAICAMNMWFFRGLGIIVLFLAKSCSLLDRRTLALYNKSTSINIGFQIYGVQALAARIVVCVIVSCMTLKAQPAPWDILSLSCFTAVMAAILTITWYGRATAK